MSPETGTIDREQLLNEILAAYLKAVRQGQAPARQELLDQHPELAPELTAFFADRDYVNRLAAPLRQALADGPVLRPGMVLDNYDVLEEIGQGGMGLIFKARQRSLNRIVALKMLRLGPWATPDDLQRFRTEADAVAHLDHAHIVPIYEVGTFHGQPYFTMKLMEGGSLARALGREPAGGGKDGRRRAAEVVATVARAVHYAHQRGILHRDLKPANILLDAAGQPHVTDFGLAKRLRVRTGEPPAPSANGGSGTAEPPTADYGEGLDGGPTQVGSVLGTPSYMAPEQAAGQKGLVTTAADVYGLGAILYELLTGRPPFRGETPLETLHQLMHEEPPRPRGLCPEVERDLETIALKCLEKDPRQRYASALALAEDLERFVAGKPIHARPVGVAERLWRWCRRQPALAAVSGFAVVAVAAVVVGSIFFALREAHHAGELQHQQDQTQHALEEARRQQAVAEESFRQAHQAVNDFCVRVSQQLEAVPHLQPLRKELLEAALRYYQTFLDQRAEDPKLRRELADTHRRVAEIYSSRGSKPRALEAFEKSLALYQELLRDNPGDVGLQEEAAWIQYRIGTHQPTVEASLKAHRENLELLEPLVRDHPGSLYLRESRTANTNSLAIAHRKMGHLDEALRSFERVCELQQQLADRYPDKPVLRKNLAIYVNNLGIYQSDMGQADAALQTFQRALDIRRKLAQAEPQNEKYQFDVAASSRDIGMVQSNTGRQQEALAAFEQARAIRERLAQANPGVTLYRNSLAASHRDVGQALQKLDRLDEARASFERSRVLQEELVKADPTVAQYQYDLAHCHFLAGDIHKEQAHRPEAVRAFRKAQELLEALIRRQPDNLDYSYILGLNLDSLGMTLQETGRTEEALVVLEQALAHQKTAYGKAPKVRHYRNALNKQYRHLAEVHRAAGRAAAAVEVSLRRRELWKGNGAELMDVAGDLARAAQAVGRDKATLSTEERAERERYHELALETLRQALAAGYKDSAALQSEPAFELLRPRADFQELVKGISK
jgi:serine/threonine protein kinase/tetratricopeptide (TPR) repeat protein